MPIFKAQNNDTCIADIAPNGWVEISQQELEEIRASREPLPRPPTPLELLAKLDADNALTQRNLRDTIMLMSEAFKAATNGAIDLSQVRGVQMVYAVEAEAEALRAQL